MTHEQQNIAIARLCGWTHSRTISQIPGSTRTRVVITIKDPRGKHCSRLPDYVSSLPAINDALTSLTPSQQGTFLFHLHEVLPESHSREWSVLLAPSHLRAIAFLKTFHKFALASTSTPSSYAGY